MPALSLREPQVPMADWMRSHERCGMWAGMGIGKSSATLYTLDLLRLLGEIGDDPTLVIGPMRVARDTWPEEVAKWDNFRALRVIPLTGTPKQRLDKLKVRADIFTISYELIPWLVEHYLEKWPFRQVVADESDRLKGLREKKGGISLSHKKAGASGARAFQLARVAHTMVRRWVNLTGTPAPAGYEDLWGQTWYLDRGERLGRTFGAFQQRWFRPKFNGYGVELLPFGKKEIDERLKDICLTVDPKDYFDLREPIVRTVEVILPGQARKSYRELERELFTVLETGETVAAPHAAALTNKCLQLANGAVYTQHPNWSPVHEAKLEALESILHESGGMPLLVAYQFQSDKARILQKFKGAADISTADGMRAFRSGNARLGVAHPKSMGHGIDGLQHVTNILVRFGHDWKTGERLQMLERIGPMRQLGAGYDRPVYVYDIVAKDTLDEAVLAAHEFNISAQDALLAAMKRRNDAVHKTS